MIRLLTLACFLTLCFSSLGIAKTPRAKAAKKLASVTITPFVQRGEMEYVLLATKKTSSMQKEMNEAGAEGYHFEGTMGGETSIGGNEAVVILGRPKGGKTTASYQYKLLATNKTSTMQKEMNQAAAAGFVFKGQTVFESTFGGKEVVVIMEMGGEVKEEYQLLATSKTSTMQKEMNQVAAQGFYFCGITVAETAFGGKELVVIMRKPR